MNGDQTHGTGCGHGTNKGRNPPAAFSHAGVDSVDTFLALCLHATSPSHRESHFFPPATGRALRRGRGNLAWRRYFSPRVAFLQVADGQAGRCRTVSWSLSFCFWTRFPHTGIMCGTHQWTRRDSGVLLSLYLSWNWKTSPANFLLLVLRGSACRAARLPSSFRHSALLVVFPAGWNRDAKRKTRHMTFYEYFESIQNSGMLQSNPVACFTCSKPNDLCTRAVNKQLRLLESFDNTPDFSPFVGDMNTFFRIKLVISLDVGNYPKWHIIIS